MPIVISEFEIVPEPAPPIEPPPSTKPGDASTTRLPAPHDVALAMHHEWRRALRVRAD